MSLHDELRFGLYVTTALQPGKTQDQVFDEAVAQIQYAEQLGFDGAWLLEHHFTRYGLCPHPLAMASYVLGRTRSIRLGTAVTVLPLRHPIDLAEQAAMIDQLSGGRLDFGIGRGVFSKDFAVFGSPPEKSHLIMREWIEIIERAWRNETVEWDSELISFPAIPVYPTPRTHGGPPIYVVCESASTTEWVASKGYSMIMSWWLEHEAIRAQVELYEEVARSYGHDPAAADHIISCVCSVGDFQRGARDAIRENFWWWRKVGLDALFKFEELRKLPNYRALLRHWEEAALQAGDSDQAQRAALERIIELNMVGTPEQCADRFSELAKATGVRHFVCGFEALKEQELIQANIGRFVTEVVPKISL